jgi:hypothetical protein
MGSRKLRGHESRTESLIEEVFLPQRDVKITEFLSLAHSR